MKKGTLYLIPVPIGEDALHTIPVHVIELVHRLDYFIAERAKTARRYIKSTGTERPISELHFAELNKRTTPEEKSSLLDPAMQGHDMGLLSEAGCPGVADPGAEIVAMAHRQGIKVVPLVGPSSILLALMASGMNGQQFAFWGYLSPKRPELAKELKRLEGISAREKQTQIFIETPYRNQAFIEVALQTLQPGTRFCMALDLTTPEEYVKNLSIKEWQKEKLPDVHKRPAIFLLYAGR
jgi:16S rRNA (cytidine1402-2'-O)-methyltransferase